MYQLTTEQQTVLEKVRTVADNGIKPNAAVVDSESRFPAESMKALGEAGLMGLNIPAELGGLGQSPTVMVAAVDEIAQRCGSTAMVYMMHLNGVAGYLANPNRFAAELRAAATGNHLSTLAFSEKGSRSQFWAPVSQVQANGTGGYSLSAEKSWVTSAGFVDGIVSSSKSVDGQGASIWLVKRDDPGVAASGGWDSLGMRGNDSKPMTYSNVQLTEDRLIGEEGTGMDIMLGRVLPVFLMCQGAIGVGLAEAAYQATHQHINAHGFEHTGTKLSDLPNQRARLARLRIAADTARSYLASTVAKVEAGSEDAMLHLLAVKANSGEAAVSSADLAMRACGGAAFSKHLGLERVFRDSRAAIVMAPTNDHLHEFIGRLLCGMELFG